MSMKTLFRKELQEIRSDLRRPVFLFGAALAYLIVFGILYLPNIVTAVPCVVLDPFNGSGTTGHVATTEGRRYIGFDLNPDYLTMSADRIARGLRPSAHLAARPIRPASGQLSLFG